MKDYNWREERKKYTPDFQQKETTVHSTPSAAPAAEKKSRSPLFFIGGIILAAAVILGGIFVFKGKDSSTKLAECAEENKHSVGLVVLTIELNNGKKLSNMIGTAWAFAPDKFATNGHVAIGLRSSLQNVVKINMMQILNELAKNNNCKSVDELLKKLGSNANAVVNNARKQVISMIKGVRADIIINATRKKSFSVTHVQVHKDYGAVGTSYDPDVAVFTVNGKNDSYFKLADQTTLENLKSGVPIAFLGFPSEYLEKENVNIDNPVASMQSGIVVAVSDFDMKDAGGAGNFLLRHNLPATGGASGSPIFNRNGEVIALLYGGNIIGQVKKGNVTRAPSAAQINFGVRVDLLSGLGEAESIKDFLKL